MNQPKSDPARGTLYSVCWTMLAAIAIVGVCALVGCAGPNATFDEPCCMTFVAVWNGKAETQESRNAENEEQLELERAENEGLANWHRERTGHDEREDEGVS